MLWKDIWNHLKTVVFGNQRYVRQCCTRPRCTIKFCISLQIFEWRIFSLVNSCSRFRGIYAHTRPSEYLCKYRLSSKFRNLTTIFQLIPLIFTMIIRFVFWHGQIGSVKYYLRSKMLRYFLSNFCPRYSWYFDGYKTILLEIKIVSSYLK